MAPYIGSPDEANGTDALKFQQIYCSGSPYEIGFKHGSEGNARVRRTIEFYAGMFEQYSKMDWTRVREVATTFEPVIRRKWPEYLEEMHGVAEGAGVPLSDIIACNVRTEIAFGCFSDGCTALSWRTNDASFLAQNWDWMEAQKPNLVILHIDQRDKPSIKMVTEAGLIGKIGLNSAGVGVCLNAIRITGMDQTRIPTHLGLRLVLDSSSREDAVQKLEKCGVASACHMLIADEGGSIGLEWSSTDLQKCKMNDAQQVFHSNHFLQKHPGVGEGREWMADSLTRVDRIGNIANRIEGKPTMEKVFELFKDEDDFPGAICRAAKEFSAIASLFNIVMDLKAKKANVTLGRPVEPEEFVQLAF